MPKSNERPVWERVKEAMLEAGYSPTQKEAAKLFRLAQPSISDWNREGGPKLAHAIEIAKRLNVCVEWLYTEREPKRPGPPDDPLAQELWNYWGRLPEETRRDFVGLARLTAEKHAPPRPRAAGSAR